MTRTVKDIERSERLRELVSKRFGERGRFRLLEQSSEISATKWKNFFYAKQEATLEMVTHWCKKYPEDENWLLTGQRLPKPEKFPFLAPVPQKWKGQTIGDRLNWVITELAAPVGKELFEYLEDRSDKKIPAADWAKLILRQMEPTAEMICVICLYRPYFAEWVLTGMTTHFPQVDPTNEQSIQKWIEAKTEIASTIGAIRKNNA